MYWRSGIACLLLAGNALAAEGYIVGFGLEGDSADGLGAALIGDVAVGSKTWLTGAVARSAVDFPDRPSVDSWYGDLEIDHLFDPVGVSLGVSYWGNSDTLDSRDWRGSVYWRGDRLMLAGEYEYRDFRFDLPATDFFPGRVFRFDANGIGVTARIDLTEKVSLGLQGKDYDYGANLRLDRNRGLLQLLAFSRLSLINSLVDYRVGASLGVDTGKRYWRFETAMWKGEADGGTTRSATLRLTTPMGDRGDIEFGLGVDNSDLYGSVTILSVFLYFYGGT
ncbi:MAG: hypothetical protein EX272_06505 [Chromatiales bacterium]|nr:MAG: hypothetical protein EX272_06505 [Chromatiales bacterium]